MSSRPDTTLWDVAQLNAGKSADARPFSGSHSNRRVASEVALRRKAIRLASVTENPELKTALLGELRKDIRRA